MAGVKKFEAYKVSFCIVKDSTGIPSQATNKMTVLMDAQSASAERAIMVVKQHLLDQGNISKEDSVVDSVSARRLKIFESTRLDDLGETIIAD